MTEQELLDTDIAARTAMLFGQGMTREDALDILGVPFPQIDAWEDLWDGMEKEARRKSRKG